MTKKNSKTDNQQNFIIPEEVIPNNDETESEKVVLKLFENIRKKRSYFIYRFMALLRDNKKFESFCVL